MFIATLAAGALLAPAPQIQTKAISASLFKNGYAVIVREAQIPGSGQFTIEDFPQAVLGTLWLTASKGVLIREAVVATEESTSETEAASLDEILVANVGKTLTFTVNGRQTTEITGKLLSASGPILVIETANVTRVIQKASVSEVASSTGELVWKIKRTTQKKVVRLKTESAGAGKIYLVSLERGLTWAPAYSVDISSPTELQLVSKATILNDLVDLNDIEVRLITGFPNIQFLNLWDPFGLAQSVDQFTNSLMQMGTPPQMRGSGRMMSQNAAPATDFSEAFPVNNTPGFGAEDLFFYRQPSVTLKKGERGYYVLFTMKSPYEHIYEWDIPDYVNESQYVRRDEEPPSEVWHSLKFTNTAKQPLTTGPATVFKGGEILSQDLLSYTSAGGEGKVRMTKALDVKVEESEEEIARKRDEVPIRGSYYDLVTVKGTLLVQNRKSETLKLKITKDLTGELISAELNPKVKSVAKGLKAVNPRQRLEWTITLKSGEKAQITYSYKVYINR